MHSKNVHCWLLNTIFKTCLEVLARYDNICIKPIKIFLVLCIPSNFKSCSVHCQYYSTDARSCLNSMEDVRIPVLAIDLVLATSSNLPSADCDSSAISKSLICYPDLSCRYTIQGQSEKLVDTLKVHFSKSLICSNALGSELHLGSPLHSFGFYGISLHCGPCWR